MENLYLQQVKIQDTEMVMSLIGEAKQYLKEQGVDQWQNGYPDLNIINEDILYNRGYFVSDGAHQLAYLCIDFEGEPAYAELKGKWKSDLPYATIHRIAVSNVYKGKGLSENIFRLAGELCLEKGIYSIRVDTDEDNAIMRHILMKNGYEYCGTIWFDNSTKYAYEKELKSVDKVQ